VLAHKRRKRRVYDIRFTVERDPIGRGVVGFAAFKHCLTALVMATTELYEGRMVTNIAWAALYMVNRILEEMPPQHEERWAMLSGLPLDQLRERWSSDTWPEGFGSVDNPLDDETPPF
jgi:hypothetical protein